MTSLQGKIENIYSDALTLSGLCDLAECIYCEHDEWDLAPLLRAMVQIADRVSTDLDRVNLRKGDDA